MIIYTKWLLEFLLYYEESDISALSPLDKELKAETDIAKKQHQKLNNIYDSEKNNWKRKTNI